MLSHGIPANPLSFKHDRSQKKQNNEFVSVKWNIPLQLSLDLWRGKSEQDTIISERMLPLS